MTSGTSNSDLTAAALASEDEALRFGLFDALGQSPRTDLAYVNTGREALVVNTRDKFVSREIFGLGAQGDLARTEAALAIVTAARAAPALLVDIGANIGSICVPALARGLFSRTVAIEPHPVNARLLRANIALNGLHDRARVHECAVGSRDDATLDLELSEDNWGDHRVRVSNEDGLWGEGGRSRMPVSSMTLDTLLRDEPVDAMMLWMDIQGYEGHALLGAQRLLSARPPLVVEFWPYGMRRAGSFAALQSAISGYVGFRDLSKPAALRPLSELPMLASEIGEGGNFTDILLF
jgi:FkbM family methyltransferase